LVVIGEAAEIRARDLSEAEPLRGRAVQVFGDRVLIAELSPRECEVVAATVGVDGVFSDTVPAHLDLSDDATAEIAVRAWNARRLQQAAGGKLRIGDGAAWDDPHFEPEGRPQGEPADRSG
jgi:hypothetical protein